jgi:hypothetical protein
LRGRRGAPSRQNCRKDDDDNDNDDDDDDDDDDDGDDNGFLRGTSEFIQGFEFDENQGHPLFGRCAATLRFNGSNIGKSFHNFTAFRTWTLGWKGPSMEGLHTLHLKSTRRKRVPYKAQYCASAYLFFYFFLILPKSLP